MKKLIVGNWKMNLSRAQARDLATALATRETPKADIVLCPAHVWLAAVARTLQDSGVRLGAQDVSAHDSGAFTGEISAAMLQELNVSYVIVGHSERRHHHLETDPQVRAKAEAAIRHGIIPIICVGETAFEREGGRQQEIVARQLDESLPKTGTYVVAYEPVWAIGTGKTATIQDIEKMHRFIRETLARRVDRAEQVTILYGGSVKAANAPEILATANVDGVLVGGASLQAEEFWAIAQS